MGTTRSSLAFTTDRGAEPGLLRPACSGVQWQQCRPELRLHPGSVQAGVRTTATAAAVPTVRQPATWRTRDPSECDAAAAVPAVRAVPATSTPAAGLLLKAIRTRREVCTLKAQVERSLLLHPLLGPLCRLRRTLRHRPPHSRKRRREHHWRCFEWLDPQPQHRLSFGSHRGSRLRPCHPPALSRKDLHESDPRDLPLPDGGNERWLCHLPLDREVLVWGYHLYYLRNLLYHRLLSDEAADPSEPTAAAVRLQDCQKTPFRLRDCDIDDRHTSCILSLVVLHGRSSVSEVLARLGVRLLYDWR